MRPPTSNAISQGKHGQYNAVDYRAKDQNNNWNKGIYAPCKMRISFYGDNGTAGKQIQAYDEAGRRHGFAHTESIAVAVSSWVEKGQLIGTMGYTGYTIPSGVNGTHLHWTILSSGTYIYPPSLITEPFNQNNQGDDMILSTEAVKTIYRRLLKREGDPGGIKNYTGKSYRDWEGDMLGSQEFKNANTIVVEKPVEVVKEVIKEVEVVKDNPAQKQQIDELSKALAIKDNEIAVLKAQVGDNSKWETFKALIRELFNFRS